MSQPPVRDYVFRAKKGRKVTVSTSGIRHTAGTLGDFLARRSWARDEIAAVAVQQLRGGSAVTVTFRDGSFRTFYRVRVPAAALVSAFAVRGYPGIAGGR